ncbi:MAG: topoisomerase DNA-binding C4 zinc finger domain-containing protein [Planctomycetota bacterium]
MSCPECGPATKLQVRTNKSNGNQFLGCPNWPDCNHTQGIPEYFYIKASGQRTLFD